MHRRIVIILILFISLVRIVEAKDPRDMEFPPVTFKPPQAERVVLNNGMVLYLLEDHELPIVKIIAMIRTGSIYEPNNKIGLAGITGAVMRTGGTRSMTGNEIDEELEFLAANISTGIGKDAGSAFLDFLKKDLDRGLFIFSEILMYPAFEQERLDLAKKQAIEAIRRRNDHPASIASREFLKQLYGADHPYARESTIETIENITREDLIEFHKKYYHPNNIIMGIAGDFNKEDMVEKINMAFKDWERGEIQLPPVPPVKEEFRGSVNYIQKDLPQTNIRIGHLGIRQDNPDFFALSIMNDILGGGGFTTRLFKDVRSKQGLAYSVGSVFSPGKLDLGIFVAFCETKGETTVKAIRAIVENIRRLTTEMVSEEELKIAKDSFLNSFVFSFSNAHQIVSRQVSLEYYNMPKDYLERFRDNVAKVTREDILRVARKYLHPDEMIILVVGKEESFDNPLSTLGKVKTIDINN